VRGKLFHPFGFLFQSRNHILKVVYDPVIGHTEDGSVGALWMTPYSSPAILDIVFRM